MTTAGCATVARAFTPARVDAFAARVRDRARNLLAAARDKAEDGATDVVRTVTDEYALLNLTDLLGVPPADRALLLEWTVRVIGYQDPEDAPAPLLGPDGKPSTRAHRPCSARCSRTPANWPPTSARTPATT